MRNNIIIISIIVLILAAAVGGFFIFKNNQAKQTPAQILPEGQLEYKNVSQNFSLLYPKELSVKDYDEGDTTHTIVFSDTTGNNTSTSSIQESFQVFFTPYPDNAITKSRIIEDVPNGKFTEPVEVVLGDGTHALAFWSEQDAGEMREVWFIHGGYLFEVTAYKELDSWLAGIMKTWKFLAMPTAGI